jgi:hypothetical protein
LSLVLLRGCSMPNQKGKAICKVSSSQYCIIFLPWPWLIIWHHIVPRHPSLHAKQYASLEGSFFKGP